MSHDGDTGILPAEWVDFYGNSHSRQNYLGIPVLLQYDVSERFLLPGGRVEFPDVDEGIIDGLIREMREEHPGVHFDFYSWYYDCENLPTRQWSTTNPNVDFLFAMFTGSPEIYRQEGEGVLEIIWADYRTCLYLKQTGQMPPNIWELIKLGYERLAL